MRPTRRALALLGAASVAVALAAGPSSAAAPPSSWQAAGFDAGKSYWDSAEVTINATRVAALKLSYSIKPAPDSNPSPDPDVDCMNPIPPLESAGRLFEVGQDGISGYNQWSGARLWNIPQDPAENDRNRFAAMSVTGNDLVVALTNCESESNSDAHMLLRNVATGAALAPDWYVQAGISGMVVSNGVIVTAQYAEDEDFVVAYDLTGHQLWERDDLTGPSFGVPLIASGGKVFLATYDATNDGRLVPVAVTIATGTTVWTASTAFADIIPVAASQDGKAVYADGPGATLFAYVPATGALSSLEVAGRGSELMAVDATTVYTSCASTALCATKRSNGASLWTISVGGVCQPVVADAVVYCNGKAFRTSNGKRVKSPADGVPVTSVAGGRVYGLLASGTVVSYK
jgi:PQQ-like domain